LSTGNDTLRIAVLAALGTQIVPGSRPLAE